MENEFRMAAGRFLSVACVSTVHFASDHRLARDLLHGMLAWYGAAYVEQMYSQNNSYDPPRGSELQGLQL